MRHIAATILFLCISNAQDLFQAPNYRFHDVLDSRRNAVRSLLKRQSDTCVGMGKNWTTCRGSLGDCCETGSGVEQCCNDGFCCPTTDLNLNDGISWYCDSVGGCCFNDATTNFSDCSGTVPPAAAVPSKAATPSSHAQSFKNVTVSATDPRITYTPQWNLGSSTCDASQQSKKTVTTNQTLSFNTQGFSVGSGSAIYVDFSQKSASFKILINGQPALNGVGVLNNCTYNGPISLSTASEIQILVDGMTSGESQGTGNSDWFFEFNSFVVTQKSSASKVTGATPSARGVGAIGVLFLAVVLSI